MKEQYKFGTAINCIDGRTQQPVIDYIKQNYDVDIVDMITFPGANGIFSNELRLVVEASLAKHSASISVEKHNSRIVAIVGHYDCAGNPGDKSHHYVQIRKALQEISLRKLPAKIIGLYFNDNWQVEEVE
jgi:hypothetical protein